MARGKLDPPNLDDRKWQDIVDQARALIPLYAPEWTDHNPSDLGMTLVELFAWMVEGMIYRLNRVPEKHMIEFLNLIGVTREPAQPATTYLTYTVDKGQAPVYVPKGSQAATQQTENDLAVLFETDEDLLALPMKVTHALLLESTAGTAYHYRNVTSKVAGVPQTGLTLSIAGGASLLLALGFDAPTLQSLPLRLRFLQPVDPAQLQVDWVYSTGTLQPLAWPGALQAAPRAPTRRSRSKARAAQPASAAVSALQLLHDETNGCRQHGVVQLRLPETWRSENPSAWTGIGPAPGELALDLSKEPPYWVALRLTNLTQAPVTFGLEALWFNSVRATNALTMTTPELIGVSSGKPFQTFELRQRPLYKDPSTLDPYHHLQVEVRELQTPDRFGEWIAWRRVEEFPAGEGLVYRLHPVTGVIEFGNYHPTLAPGGHGSMPSKGSEIRTTRYRYVVGGLRGNVAAGAVNVIRKPVAGVRTVQNWGKASGGTDEEPLNETKRRGPELLRQRHRAVTVEDYEFLAREAAPEVKNVRALAALQDDEADNNFGELTRTAGMVNVIIVPAAPLAAPRPMPSQPLINRVSAYLEQRSIIGTHLHVTHPRYLPINTFVTLRVWDAALANGLIESVEQVAAAVREKLDQYLHPVLGGSNQEGWEVGQDVTIASLFEFIRPDPAIGFIAQIDIQAGTTNRPPGFETERTAWVKLADYELVCSGIHTIDIAIS